MKRPDPLDVVFHGCAALNVAALVVLYMLRSERTFITRWLDRRIDRAVTLPAPPPGRGRW